MRKLKAGGGIVRLTLRSCGFVLAALLGTARAGGARADGTPCALLAPEFDRTSSTGATCMVCHDGSAAPPIAERGCHPVDVSYARAWLGGERALNGTIPAALVLSSGRITCATCHDGASPYPHRTAVDAASLCTACHAR